MDAQSGQTDEEEFAEKLKKHSDLQEERIADLMKESLAAGNVLEATIGSMNAQVMLITKRYGKVITQAAEMQPETFMELDELGMRFGQYLKFVKVVERLSSLQLKIRKEGG
jgi:hypothetical protein